MRKPDEILTAALRAVAEDDATLRASAAVEARLLVEVSAIAALRRRRRLALLGAAAALLVAIAVPAYRIGTRRATEVATTTAAGVPDTSPVTEVTTAFLPLAYSSAPITDGQLVRLAVPRAALGSFSLAPVDAVALSESETVIADVLVGEDGLARAVRFVRQSNTVKD